MEMSNTEITLSPDRLVSALTSEVDAAEAELRAAEERVELAVKERDQRRRTVEDARDRVRATITALQARIGDTATEVTVERTPPKATITSNEKVAKAHGGKTRRDIVILLMLDQDRPMRCAEIAKLINEDSTPTYNTLSALRESVFVEQDDAKTWKLTDRGREHAQKLKAADTTIG